MSEQPSNVTPIADAAQSDQQIRNLAYSAATTRLRNNHLEEFRTILEEETVERGLEYKPRLTKQEKAAAEVARLVAEYGQDILPTA